MTSFPDHGKIGAATDEPAPESRLEICRMTRPDKKTSNNGLDLNFTSPTAWSVGAFIVRSVAMMGHTDEQAWEISWKNKKDKFWGNF